MDKMLSVDFVYKSKTYFALISCRQTKNETQHHVTILNGYLQGMIDPHQVVHENDGKFSTDTNEENKQLMECILEAMQTNMCH
jgi:hypothetical protein